MKDYIDAGDRIVSISELSFGEPGLVLTNDGFGRCEVLLDNGSKMRCWNGRHLIRAGESLPNESVKNERNMGDAHIY